MSIEDFTPEQVEMAKACKTAEELFDLAKQEGVELTDEQLDQVSGGVNWGITDNLEKIFNSGCPRCGSSTVLLSEQDGKPVYKCADCGNVLDAPVLK